MCFGLFLPLLGTILRTPFACFFQLTITLLKDRLLATFEHVLGRYITECTVEPSLVIFLHVLTHNPLCILQAQRNSGANAFALKRFVKSLDLTITLWIEWTGANMSHTADTYELFEVFSDELRAVIRDHSGSCRRGDIVNRCVLTFSGGVLLKFSVDEFLAFEERDDLLMAVEASPSFLRGLGELEYHG